MKTNLIKYANKMLQQFKIYIIYDEVQVDLIHHNKIYMYKVSMLLFKITDHMYKTLNVTGQY